MLRNRELLWSLLLGLAAGGLTTLYCFSISPRAGAAVCILTFILLAAGLAPQWYRYRELRRMCRVIDRILNGDYSLDPRDNREGELSVLKSQLYKVTVAFSQQAEQLKQDKLTLSDAISDISHQLKTPMTSMLVMTDLLCDADLPAEKRTEFTSNIRTQLERMQWLVSALLKLARLDAGTVSFQREKMTAAKLFQRASAPLLIPMELKAIHLKTECDDTSIICDPNWTAEALVNLIKNAVEHTPEGGSITLSASENPLYTELAVQDSGGGIDREDLPYLFTRFHRGKNAHSDSVGIGLAMAQEIISRQDGNITVKSIKGRGSRFVIHFYKHPPK